MKESVFYVDAKTKIVDFLTAEFIDFPPKLQNRFLNFFPFMPNYQEEGKKHRPVILFTNNINAIIKALPHPNRIQMFDDKNEHMFSSRMKSLIPFCKHDWYIYLNICDADEGGRVQYGIFRDMHSIKDRLLEDIIFTSEALHAKAATVSTILAYAENNWTVTLRSLKGNVLTTNFALDIIGHNNIDHEIEEFVEASFSKLKTTQKKLEEVKTMYRNIFKNVLKDIDGTICVVLDKDYVDLYFGEKAQEDLFADGIWLREPISLSKLFLRTDQYSEQKLTSIADVFMTMLNFDGITVVDNMGQILAYNVFVDTNHKTTGSIIGGARKRAAYTIINSRKKGIIGVYFQSYDGEMFFAQAKK